MKITKDNFLEEAEKVIKGLQGKTDRNGRTIPQISVSQIRNILAMSAEIYTTLREEKDGELAENLRERVHYLRLRCIYDSGRDAKVKTFVEEAKLLTELQTVKTKQDFITFNHYMEALVAWHRFLGGKD